MPSHNTLVAELWDDVYRAVIEKERKPDKFNQIYIGKIECPANSPVHQRKTPSRTANKYLAGEIRLSSSAKDVSLTRREVQVLDLICQGATNLEVASSMGLSVRTVEYYIKNMRRKTLTKTKADLIQLAVMRDGRKV